MSARALPLAHLSVELGHLYFEDFQAGPDALAAHFGRIEPWARAALEIHTRQLGDRRPRISTCFLIDDYFGPTSPPESVIPPLLAAAAEHGLRIDYLVREAACAEADGAPLAQLVEERIVADPPPLTTGTRPPPTEAGWLCNGQRTPTDRPVAAMESPQPWSPPAQNGATRHSVFVDVELWSPGPDRRVWSCAFLAAVWQLLRLGLLRQNDEPVATPRGWQGPLPPRWDELPAVLKLNDAAAPFHAYRALSILPRRFLPTEHAVRTILDQTSADPAVAGQIVDRARREGIELAPEPVERIDYVFVG